MTTIQHQKDLIDAVQSHMPPLYRVDFRSASQWYWKTEERATVTAAPTPQKLLVDAWQTYCYAKEDETMLPPGYALEVEDDKPNYRVFLLHNHDRLTHYASEELATDAAWDDFLTQLEELFFALPEAPMEEQIRAECAALAEMLVDKNRKYGNSALSPVRIFSKASPKEQILVRMDDKLSRLRTASLDEDEDVLLDLLGYGILYRIADKE